MFISVAFYRLCLWHFYFLFLLSFTYLPQCGICLLYTSSPYLTLLQSILPVGCVAAVACVADVVFAVVFAVVLDVVAFVAVSYTHLDVYKRQLLYLFPSEQIFRILYSQVPWQAVKYLSLIHISFHSLKKMVT